MGIGVSVLAIFLGLCGCIIRHNRQMAFTNQTNLSAHNSRVQTPPYSFTNMGSTTVANPLQKPFTIPMSSPRVVQDQAVSPPYLSVSSPPTREEQNGV